MSGACAIPEPLDSKHCVEGVGDYLVYCFAQYRYRLTLLAAAY